SRFYEKAASSLGMAARRYRASGRGERIRYAVFTLPIGRTLVAATSRDQGPAYRQREDGIADSLAAAAGERIRYAVFTLPIGRTLVAATSRGLCAVKLGEDEATLRRLIGEEFSAAELIEDPAALGEIRDSIA